MQSGTSQCLSRHVTHWGKIDPWSEYSQVALSNRVAPRDMAI